MTGKQRALAALRGQRADRVPVIPIVGQAAASFCGVSIREHAHDARTLARCQVECARRFGYDGVYIAADTWVNAEAAGFPRVEHPADAPACGHGTWIESEEQIEALELPDPKRSGRWPLMVEAVRHAVAMAGDELLIIGNFDQSPFGLACQLRGINRFLLDIVENQELAHRLLDYCTRAVSRYALALAEAGAHVLNTGDSAAGGSLIGARAYAEFAFPYERKVFAAVRARFDTPITLHICGDTSTCIDRMIETGATGIEIDHAMDLRRVRQVCRERVTAIGNVNPVDTLLGGTPDSVRAACRACLEAFAGSNRFILATGCAISPLTPPANLTAMAEAALEGLG
ncbi:MAG TPA: uroporphyrinogen decarboxylase family protein [Candidatus Paceibacterota bacterium]|nr:uroporphyrinogen decarboxylase family protein [Verrucomicrobiota bacterium]HSA11096.1 uroporphyrinogen decarboxylase family protein [Candidatus Paceibacterota bacterium]